MAQRYVVSLTNSWSTSIEAENPKEAAITLLRKNEPSLKDSVITLVKDTEHPQITVMLARKTGRKILNKYRIEATSSSVNSRVDTVADNTLNAKMDLVTFFKAERSKARERYARAVASQCGDDREKLMEWEAKTKANVKRMIKDGATPQACAKAFYDKKSVDLSEVIMTAENFKSDYVLYDHEAVKDKRKVLEALKKGVCLFLVDSASGGSTTYMGTANLRVHEKLYEFNTYTLYKMADIYSDYMSITPRKVDLVKQGSKTPEFKSENIRIASCSLRMKDETVKGVPTGRFKVSSVEYSVALDNIICMALFTNLPQVDKTVTDYLAQGFMMAGGNDVEFAKKFAFDREAFNFALRTFKEKRMPYVDVVNALERRGKAQGISEEDIALYRQSKDEKLGENIKYVALHHAAGLTATEIFKKYGISID